MIIMSTDMKWLCELLDDHFDLTTWTLICYVLCSIHNARTSQTFENSAIETSNQLKNGNELKNERNNTRDLITQFNKISMIKSTSGAESVRQSTRTEWELQSTSRAQQWSFKLFFFVCYRSETDNEEEEIKAFYTNSQIETEDPLSRKEGFL